jgi:hypothetical protein
MTALLIVLLIVVLLAILALVKVKKTLNANLVEVWRNCKLARAAFMWEENMTSLPCNGLLHGDTCCCLSCDSCYQWYYETDPIARWFAENLFEPV